MFKEGDRVVFVDNNQNYSLGPSNPIVGSKWFCGGIVCHTSADEVAVDWDNGLHNIYFERCLQHEHENVNPNLLFKIRKR